MAVKLVTVSAATLAAGNTRQQITASGIGVTSVTIQADTTNTSTIYVGDETVTTSNGLEIPPGESIEITPPDVRGHSEDLILSDLYIIGTLGDIARIAAFKRRN